MGWIFGHRPVRQKRIGDFSVAVVTVYKAPFAYSNKLKLIYTSTGKQPCSLSKGSFNHENSMVDLCKIETLNLVDAEIASNTQ